MIIDSHIHMGNISRQYNYSTLIERVLEVMDSVDIRYAIATHSIALEAGYIELGMKESIKAYHQSGGRLLAYYFYDPRRPELSLDIMDYYHDREVFRGIKIHPAYCSISADDESFRPVWEYASVKKLPLLSHTWDFSITNPSQKYAHPSLFEKYIREFMDVKFIFGHSGGRYKAILTAADIGRKYENLYFDIAGDIHINNLIEFLCGSVGDEKILFGSDCPMMDQRTMLGAVLDADISPQSKEKILCNNARRLFRI